jgi:putative glycosyltransferase (TIGR04372 family)
MQNIKSFITILSSYLRHRRDQGELKYLWIYYYFFYRCLNNLKFFLSLIAVEFRVPFKQAYPIITKKYLNKLYQILDSGVNVEFHVSKIYTKLRKYSALGLNHNIRDIEFDKALIESFLLMGKANDWKDASLRLIENQEYLASNFHIHKLRFLEPEEIFRNLGTTVVLDSWIKSGLLGLRPESKTLVLVESHKNLIPVNPCLIQYWKSYIDFIYDQNEIQKYIKLSKFLCSRINYYLPTGSKVIHYTHSAVVYIQKLWEDQGRQPLIQLSESHKFNGKVALKRFGIPENSWFVVTHVREAGYKGGEKFRDSDIYTYLNAYKEIISKGGFVIRMGDKSMKPLPKIEGLIDYALSKEKSDWLDIYLLSNAKFMLGTSSGPTTVSYIFNVPVVMTNNLPSAATYLSKKDIFMPRLLRRFDGSYVSIKETMTLPYSLGTMDSIYKNVFKVEVIPNTADEITEAVLEMMDRLNGYEIYSESDEVLQSKFKKIMVDNEMMIGIPGFSPQARLAKFFLKKHCALLD